MGLNAVGKVIMKKVRIEELQRIAGDIKYINEDLEYGYGRMNMERLERADIWKWGLEQNTNETYDIRFREDGTPHLVILLEGGNDEEDAYGNVIDEMKMLDEISSSEQWDYLLSKLCLPEEV